MKNIYKNLLKTNKYAIITNGDCMKDIICLDIQSLINKNIDVSNIIYDINLLMEKDYPKYRDWFNNKLIPGLNNGSRNIIVMYKKNKIIGYVNLKKTAKERKMSNLNINSLFYYNQCWNILVDEAIKWLDDEDPIIIISDKEFNKCSNLIYKRNWHLSDKSKHSDYIINRYDEFESFKTYFKKRRIQY